MRRYSGLLLLGLFLSASSVAWGQRVSSAPRVPDSDRLSHQNTSQDNLPGNPADCSRLLDEVRAAREVVERDRKQLSAAVDPGEVSPASNAEPYSGDLRQDLMVLHQREENLNRCTSASDPPRHEILPGANCPGEQILSLSMIHDGDLEREIPILRLSGTSAFFYESGMTIDADGAPNAYHPDNLGLDDLANAGGPGNWEGLAMDRNGEPFVQGPGDPFPGYYVSSTALADRSRSVSDPLRYVDASRIPYIVLPGRMARQLGARPGDFSVVLNQRNDRISYAIFGDVGPYDRIGEGSMALAESLGIHSNARYGGTRRGILYLVFPGSGNGRPRTIEEINAATEKLFQAWGGAAQLAACKVLFPARPFEGPRNTN